MNIRTVLEKMIAARASDLHLKAGTAPVVRVDGVLYTLDEPAPDAQALRDVCDQLLNEEQRLYFSTHNEIDFAFGVAGLARFRANIFMQRGTVALALRHVPVEVPTIEELHLPPVVRELAFSPRGLILVTCVGKKGRNDAAKAALKASLATGYKLREVDPSLVGPVRELERGDLVKDAGVAPRPAFLPREASLFPVDKFGDPDPTAKKPPPPQGLVLFRF